MKNNERLEKQAADEITELLIAFSQYCRLEFISSQVKKQSLPTDAELIDGFLDRREQVEKEIEALTK